MKPEAEEKIRVLEEASRSYPKLARSKAPRPNTVQGMSRAFLLGGTLSLIGQFVFDLFRVLEPTEGEAAAATLAAFILLGAGLTALGVYDRLAEWGGAGAAVPITGFANTVVAAALDFRREGWILGMASKMFVIAGPVIVFGAVAGVVVGLIRAAALGLFP